MMQTMPTYVHAADNCAHLYTIVRIAHARKHLYTIAPMRTPVDMCVLDVSSAGL